MFNIFTKHPRDVGETYFEHMIHAGKYGFGMLFGSFACFIHAIFPFLCEKTGSNIFLKMTDHYVSRMPHAEERMVVIADKIAAKK